MRVALYIDQHSAAMHRKLKELTSISFFGSDCIIASSKYASTCGINCRFGVLHASRLLSDLPHSFVSSAEPKPSFRLPIISSYSVLYWFFYTRIPNKNEAVQSCTVLYIAMHGLQVGSLSKRL